MTLKQTTYEPEVIDNGRFGFSICWYDQDCTPFHSAMPDEDTAFKCAAAPELLATCETLLNFAEEYAGKNRFEKERAAIAKARGQQ